MTNSLDDEQMTVACRLHHLKCRVDFGNSQQFICCLFVCLLTAFVVVVVLYIQTVLDSKRRGWEGGEDKV